MHSTISKVISHKPIEHQNLPKQWYAIYTKYKTEKYVIDHLERKGIEAYIPLLSVTKKYKSKIKKMRIPLFNCYVFVRISADERVRVLETEYVYKFIKQTNKEEAIPEEEINTLKRVVGEFEGVISANPIEWKTGQPVEVIGGSLTGIKGKLIKKSGKNNFVVELTTVGYELQIEIAESQLRLLDKVA